MLFRRTVLAGGCLVATSVAGCLSNGEPADETDGPDADDERRLISVSDGSTDIEAVRYGHVEMVGTVDEPETHEGPVVPIALSEDGIAAFRDALTELDGLENPEVIEIQLYADDELISSFGMSPGLADSIAASEWGGEFVTVTDSREEAETLHDSLTGQQ